MLLLPALSPSVLLWSLAAALLLYRFYRFLYDRPPNFPKGPPRLPLVGGYGIMLMLNYRHMHRAVDSLCRYYGTKILGLYLGSFLAVVVHDYEIVREVMNRSEFDGRSDMFLNRLRERNFLRRGIFFTDGAKWKEQRRFVLRHLRDYGFGRRFQELEEVARDEIRTLLETIQYGAKWEHEKSFTVEGGGYALCAEAFFGCLANLYLQVICGERFPRKDMGVLFETAYYAQHFQSKGDDFGTILSYLTWLKDYFPEATNYRVLREANAKMNDLIESIIERYQKSYEEGHIRCFLDRYIHEMKKCAPLDGQSFTFQYDQLVMILADFLLPTFTGTAYQLSMLLERMILNPRVAAKVQQEIDTVVGRGRLPTLDDRCQMPYTEATLREELRIDTLVPSGVAHVALEDTTLRGFNIPKDTVLMIALDAIHHQEDIWGDPNNFRPERFLDDGGLSLAKDRSIPFGAGKRLCAGETFARNSMFLMFSALMQNFNITVRPGDPLPDVTKRLTGVVIMSEPTWLKFEPR
uniref:Putative cytochrome p450 n=1 Tax=Culex tarsalis TaxID=7177 RepID=A0A1Q3FRW9_CULTA